MRKSSFALVAWLVLAATALAAESGPDTQLAAKLDPILHALDATGTVFGARVVELASGRELYAHDIDRPLMPASNGKLANDAAALDHFGPKYTFKTCLAMDGDDLWLIGDGDPGCGDDVIAAAHHSKPTAMLDEWAEALKARGVTHIKGKLYFDDGVFDDQWVSPTWSKSFLTDWYAAPVTGLTFNDNCIDVTVLPTAMGEPARYEVVPPTSAVVKIVNQTRTGTSDLHDTSEIARQPRSNDFTLSGVVMRKHKLESKPVIDPGAFFADSLRAALASHGITIDGPSGRAGRALAHQKWPKFASLPLTATPPADDRIITIHETAFLDVLTRINKNSQNLLAEAVCKMQGRDWNLAHGKDEPGSWAAGSEAVHDFLRRNHIDDSHYVLVDGSGLARENRVTARLITDLFVLMSRHACAAEYRNSLTVCGQDGTLRKRLTDIAGLIRGKTGTIGGVRSISGYATTRSGATLVFSIIYNEAPRHEKQCEELSDNACRVLVEWPDVQNAKLRPVTQPSTKPAIPLSGLPSRAGEHVAKIAAMADDTWLDLGPPAPDPVWGSARGRSWGADMAWAPDLGVAFLTGEGVHGWWDKQTGRYMDDLWAYDLRAHRWICVHPGSDVNNLDLKVNEHGVEVTPDGQPMPVAQMVHGYQGSTYDTDLHRFMFMPCSAGYWDKSMGERRLTWLGKKSNEVAKGCSPWLYDVRAGEWDRRSTGGAPAPTGHFGDVLMYVPGVKKTFLRTAGSEIWWYDAMANQWTRVSPKGPPPPFGIDPTACYDPRRNRIYIGGGSYPVATGPSALWAYDVASDTWIDLQPKGTCCGGSNSYNSNIAVMTYDAAGDVVVLNRHTAVTAKGETGMWIYDPAANAWDERPRPFLEGMSWRQVNGFYDPELNVHVYHSARDSDLGGIVRAYRWKRAR
jgi:D-alanyl-D-alanine carboxypeptidase/D-alanyl-D-alanine-endopeptidase (penicillin-binding protein 4)